MGNTTDMYPVYGKSRPTSCAGYRRPWVIIPKPGSATEFLILARKALVDAGGPAGREQEFNFSNPPSDQIRYFEVGPDIGLKLLAFDKHVNQLFQALEGRSLGVDQLMKNFHEADYARQVVDFFLRRLWRSVRGEGEATLANPLPLTTIACPYMKHVLHCFSEGKMITALCKEPAPAPTNVPKETRSSVSMADGSTVAGAAGGRSKHATQVQNYCDPCDERADTGREERANASSPEIESVEKTTSLYALITALVGSSDKDIRGLLRPTFFRILSLAQNDELYLSVQTESEATWLRCFLRVQFLVLVQATWPGEIPQHQAKRQYLRTKAIEWQKGVYVG